MNDLLQLTVDAHGGLDSRTVSQFLCSVLAGRLHQA